MPYSIAMQPAETQGVRPGQTTIAWRWISALLVGMLWTIGQTVDVFPNGPLRVDYRSVHIVLGVALGIVLHFFPNALGRNVSEAAPLVALAICVPGLRNLVEYQAELLFARGQTAVRALNLGLLAGLKAVLLTYVLTTISDTPNLG